VTMSDSAPVPESRETIKRATSNSSSICSRIFSIFGVGNNDSKDNCTTSESSDGQTERTVKRSVSSIKDDIRKANHKISFMTNYTLIEGLRTLHVKGGWDTKDDSNGAISKFPIRSYAGHSKRGQSTTDPNKKNQDALIMMEDEATKSIILACMDGHGIEGHFVAQFVKENMEKRLCSHPDFKENIKSAITDTIAKIEQDLYDDSRIDCSLSGTTFVMAVVRGSHITVANIGDSRVMLITQEGSNKYEPVALSFDHKPDDDEERERITAAGGRLLSVTYRDGTTGPLRVWRGDADNPGLAMSRSVGDRLVHEWGVISTPSFMEHDINLSEDFAIVVASDGLWNVSSDKEVVKSVITSREPSGAVGMLIRESHNHWVQSGSDTVDDTTVAVAFFNKSR